MNGMGGKYMGGKWVVSGMGGMDRPKLVWLLYRRKYGKLYISNLNLFTDLCKKLGLVGLV